ncbi:MAG TPA: hypothetical protein VHD91_12200 [Gaiellaceae bacterium]|nr:hypothetical protein [Gaiellaceae bacterium]
MEAVVAAHGGTLEYGWLLWETIPNVLLEAEFHSVWVTPKGIRRDVTPKELGFTRVVYLPDPALTYDGRQIDNKRVPLVDDPLVEEFMALERRLYGEMNRGERADQYGAMPVPMQLAVQLAELLARISAKYAAT